MTEMHTCQVCGHTDHVGKFWPECVYCERAEQLNNPSPDDTEKCPPNPNGDIFDYKAFPVPLEYAQRAARVWCMSETQNYEMQPAICYLVARLIYHLECAETELFNINSNRGTRLEIVASIRPILNALL